MNDVKTVLDLLKRLDLPTEGGSETETLFFRHLQYAREAASRLEVERDVEQLRNRLERMRDHVHDLLHARMSTAQNALKGLGDTERSRLHATLDRLEGMAGSSPLVWEWVDLLDEIVALSDTPEAPRDPAERRGVEGPQGDEVPAGLAIHLDVEGRRPEEVGAPVVAVSSVSDEAALRARMRALLATAKTPAVQDRGQWGFDFGTARSKVVRRPPGNFNTNTSPARTWPSVLAYQTDGDGVLFGDEAASKSGVAGWKTVTSLKRYMVGNRVEPKGLPARLSTERLAILYMAWLCHKGLREEGAEASPLSLPVGVSIPLVDSADPDSLRVPFGQDKHDYQSWMPYAFRAAQLVAATFADEGWPTSQKLLLDALELWWSQSWSDVCRVSGRISEPAAVIGDLDPLHVPEGLVMLVDCGAGTTDVSVFWRRGAEVYNVIERAVVAGGDVIDDDIVYRIGREIPLLLEREGELREWSRRAKPEILVAGTTTFDPEEFNQPDLAFDITRSDLQAGLDKLGRLVEGVVQRAATEALEGLLHSTLREAVDLSKRRRLDAVWLLGGSAIVPEVAAGVERGLKAAALASPGPAPLPHLDPYAAWDAVEYRLHSVALGASRPKLDRPSPLPSEQMGNFGVSDYDKDAR